MMVAGATAGVWMIYDLIFLRTLFGVDDIAFEMMFGWIIREALNLYQQTFRNYMDLYFYDCYRHRLFLYFLVFT